MPLLAAQPIALQQSAGPIALVAKLVRLLATSRSNGIAFRSGLLAHARFARGVRFDGAFFAALALLHCARVTTIAPVDAVVAVIVGCQCTAVGFRVGGIELRRFRVVGVTLLLFATVLVRAL
jgi:hypothetical protein